MEQVDPRLIASRLRRLIAHDHSNLAERARALGVGETALRSCLDEVAPRPTFEVITAVVRHYGVDPTWLMTGEYNANRHRAALAEDDPSSTTAMEELIARQLDSLPSIGVRRGNDRGRDTPEDYLGTVAVNREPTPS